MSPPNTHGSGVNGFLQINSSQTSTNFHLEPAPKLPPRLKIIVRRLPPGLTQAEFFSILGADWQLGEGKVDWFFFKPGKVSRDPSKQSRPSRAYLHLTCESYIYLLSDLVRQSTFEDARDSFSNKCLLGPPVVEYAPYGCTPSNRIPADTRAGTIDQDPEFMAFLEGLANPTKGAHPEASAVGGSKLERVTTTPLVQFLRDKKATKNKELVAKATKKHELQNMKGKNFKESTSLAEDTRKKRRDSKVDKMVGKAPRDTVKILNRETSTKTASTPTKQNAVSSLEKNSSKSDATREPSSRQRGVAIAAHIRMLQRDLGLTSAQAHRQARREASEAHRIEMSNSVEKSKLPLSSSSPHNVHTQTPPTAPKRSLHTSNTRRGRGKGHSIDPECKHHSSTTTVRSSTPLVLLKKSENVRQAQLPATTTPTRLPPIGPSWKSPQILVPTEGATQAFIKHANPSQGVTEPLLKEAMEKFGAVSKVEIDRKKGFAYVDFIETDGLKKAMAANPVSVAQGTVQVMQRKGTALPPQKKIGHQVPHGPSRSGRGGRNGAAGRRGGRVAL